MPAARVPGRLGEALARCERLLQAALDVTTAREALRYAAMLAGLPGLIVEAGTPLIKAEGIRVAGLLKAIPGVGAVVADTKTFDTGGLEARLAADAGADAMTVMAQAPRETLEEAVKAAEEAGIAVIVDLMAHPDPVAAAQAASEAGAHIALIHIGIDTQRRLGITAAQVPDLIANVANAFNGPVAVAGGVKPTETRKLAEAGASIIVIGGAILKARDPREAAEAALRGINPTCP